MGTKSLFEEVGLRRILMKKREVERFKDGMAKMCLQQLRCQWEPLTMNEQETQSRVVQGSREVVGDCGTSVGWIWNHGWEFVHCYLMWSLCRSVKMEVKGEEGHVSKGKDIQDGRLYRKQTFPHFSLKNLFKRSDQSWNMRTSHCGYYGLLWKYLHYTVQ